jgi:glycosyltransferase involved in cell wall biosynthesis
MKIEYQFKPKHPFMVIMFLLKKGECLGENLSIINNVEPVVPVAASTAPPSLPIITVRPESKKEASTDKRTKVMLCGTYPVGQSNGYSRVVYYICKYLGLKEDIRLTIYGFQNYGQTRGAKRDDIPNTVILHDAMATENPRRNGFGEKEIAGYVKEHPQDIIIIFNDPVITSSLTQNLLEGLSSEERGKFKLLSYMDQVYPYQRKDYIALLNTHFDGIIAFTPYWKDTARRLGIRADMPMFYFPHGIDTDLYYPIPSSIARVYHQLPQEAFLILNLNRNQPRKRWDHTMMVMADIIDRHQKAKKKDGVPIKLVIGTQLNGFFDLIDIIEHELKLRGYEDPKPLIDTYIYVLPNAQMLSDQDINLLYNACDIGLNTCEGEGFGLCQFEHLALMKPQVAPGIGGFKEFLHSQNSIVIESKWRYYVDKVRDGIGGMAEIGDPADYAAAIWKYYQNPALRIKHGRQGRQEILQHYAWETMVEILYTIVKNVRPEASNR